MLARWQHSRSISSSKLGLINQWRYCVLYAFLHRVGNSGGRSEREYRIGRRRMDLALIWPVRPGGGAGKAPVGAAPASFERDRSCPDYDNR